VRQIEDQRTDLVFRLCQGPSAGPEAQHDPSKQASELTYVRFSGPGTKTHG